MLYNESRLDTWAQPGLSDDFYTLTEISLLNFDVGKSVSKGVFITFRGWQSLLFLLY